MRDEWLKLDDAALLRQCEVDTYRASGPGGQKRNKTSSAVRLRHGPSGLLVIAEESRSQHENKAKALRRLRRALALELRQPVQANGDIPPLLISHLRDGAIQISRKSVDFPAVIAWTLDYVADSEGRIRDAAERIGISSGQLSRFLCDDNKVLAAVNQMRQRFGLRPLRPND